MAGVLVATAELMALYRIAWLTHRSLVASETTPSYRGRVPPRRRLAGPLPGRRRLLPPDGAAGGPVLAAGRRRGGAGLYLFGLYDLQHGIWGKGGNGLVDLVTLFVLRRAWHAFAS